ncbi:uncharacterized protein PHALS_09490 [Plasmopara halstedii]|uniref:Uncharacterized protein n=1 Tax=Plasmopara halstedii TaxID=4781 RepID=A0A0P1A4T4_PLAHL|nr:uncharacterized protein PHALS_09490 [Plasmopara halstedii]CEG35365.1 hypothetical protein PHALS_09490 [Plasmopara halstedii]|eukprot:XP_024571734.1 hypothetical protein PHALS_09490 [Plasmopara halstedii]
MEKKSWNSAQTRTISILRRGAWELRRGRCGKAAVFLLLLTGIVFSSLRGMISPMVSLTTTLSSYLGITNKASESVNLLRWGGGSVVVELEGQPLQRDLPLTYPDGTSNKFQCDLPSLRFQCDMDRGVGCNAYPQLFPSSALFDYWKQEDTEQVPASIFDSICHFNISDPTEFRLAQMFREMEVPFVTYGIPELNAALKRWTDEYLMQQLTSTELYKVHVANDSHFMFFNKKLKLDGSY